MTAQPKATPATMLQVEPVPIKSIDPSPFQKRRVFRNMTELAANIKANGLLQPVTVRKAGKRYQLVFGERRKRACESLGWPTLPVFVRDMTDQEAAIAATTENLENDSLEPIEEAESIDVLRGLGWTLEQIAEKVGHPVGWVARLASLTQLTPKWIAMIRNEKQGVSNWSAIHLAQIARLPAEVQDQLAKEFSSPNYYLQAVKAMSPRDLGQLLSNWLLALSGAPWKKDDGELVPAAGACTACQKRSDCQIELWAVEEEGVGKASKTTPASRCLDKECWGKKLAAFLKVKKAELEKEHGGNLLKLTYEWGRAYDDKSFTLVESLAPAKPGEKGAQPGLVYDGSDAGQVRWMKPHESHRSSMKKAGEKVKPKPLADRRRDYDWRRLRLIIVKLADRFEVLYGNQEKSGTAAIPGHLSAQDMLALAAAFGTHDNAGSFRKQCGRGGDRFGRYAALVKVKFDCEPILFRQACGVIEALLRSMGNLPSSCVDAKHQKEHVADVQSCAKVLGLKWADLWTEAETAIPYAKSWAKLNADGAPKGDASAKKPAAGKPKNKARKPKSEPDDLEDADDRVTNEVP